MQKDKIIELVRQSVFGGSATSDRLHQADPRRIELDITAAFNTVFFQIFKKEPSNLDRYSKQYKNVDVSYDSTTALYYSTLPAPIIQFPVTGDGIRRINTMQGVDITFVPVNQQDTELMYGLEFDEIDDVIGYYLNGSTVYYYNHDDTITSVKMDLVVPFTEWDMNEDVPVPSGKDLEIINIVREMYNLKPIDRLNNQNELA